MTIVEHCQRDLSLGVAIVTHQATMGGITPVADPWMSRGNAVVSSASSSAWLKGQIFILTNSHSRPHPKVARR